MATPIIYIVNFLWAVKAAEADRSKEESIECRVCLGKVVRRLAFVKCVVVTVLHLLLTVQCREEAIRV